MAWCEQQGVEESAEFVDGQRDQPGRGGSCVAFGGGGHGQEGVGEHGQGGPAVPGGPAADLVLVQSGEAFGGLEGFLDAPALPGDGTRVRSGDRARAVAAQVGVLAGGVVAADQQMMCTGVGVVFGQQSIQAQEYRAGAVAPAPAECFCQARWAASVGESIDADRTGLGGRPAGWLRWPARSPGRGRGWRPRRLGSAP